MDTVAFMDTLINTLKFDNKYKDKKEALLPIFRRATINPNLKYEYVNHSGYSGQHYEDIELRVPVPLIDDANSKHSDIRDLVQYVYQETPDAALGKVLIKPQILVSQVDDPGEYDAIFTDIQETVVQGIRDAKFIIWAAVAWFSNRSIYKELEVKKQQGLDVRLIISDEEQNQKLLPELKQNFDVVIIPRSGWNNYNRMHDKFCIIDLDYVMHGSYNWTPTANGNEETLTTATDRELAKKFAHEFMRMYVENKC